MPYATQNLNFTGVKDAKSSMKLTVYRTWYFAIEFIWKVRAPRFLVLITSFNTTRLPVREVSFWQV